MKSISVYDNNYIPYIYNDIDLYSIFASDLI